MALRWANLERCGMIAPMKALKSPLAQRVLADPRGKVQLRTFLATKSTATDGQRRMSQPIEIRSGDATVRVRASVVPKAA